MAGAGIETIHCSKTQMCVRPDYTCHFLLFPALNVAILCHFFNLSKNAIPESQSASALLSLGYASCSQTVTEGRGNWRLPCNLVNWRGYHGRPEGKVDA